MGQRIGIAVAVCLCMATAAVGQVVRFETTTGNFDMVLNPTNNPVLQGHVDNLLQYIENESYKGSWINRAANDFVLQMGGFYSNTKRPSLTNASVRNVRPFQPVLGEPAAENPGLSNTVGTVSMALSGLPTGGTNQDSGTTSFFVNLTSNDFLDADFTVFAAIPDMTVINQIMALPTIDRTTDPLFDADPGNLAFTDVPVQSDGLLVLIKRAFVVTDQMAIAQAMAGVQSVMSQSAEAFANQASAPVSTASGLSTVNVPEPATLVTGLASFVSLTSMVRRRRRT
jgi:cyclophilin family peptidyl-prolyl cis-trans isomerase